MVAHDARPHRSAPSRFALWYIEMYRARMPARIRPRCRYEPSCSAYALECYRRYGFLKATSKATWRLLRCNPFRRVTGIIDPP